jgi:hypothetical protein
MRKKKMLSPSQYAEKIGKPYQIVMAWLRQNRIGGVEKTEVGKMYVYLIPEDAEYTPPPMGRPKKEGVKKAAKKKAAK